MIRINLLPPQARKRRRKVWGLPLRQVATGAAVVLAGMTAGLWVVQGVQLQRRNTLKRQWAQLQPQRAQLEQVRAAYQKLQMQQAILQGIASPQAKWAGRLNLLSDSLTARLWFRSLQWKAGGRARLEGSTLFSGQAGAGNAPVARFMQRMKEHPEFSSRFQAVELEAVEQRQRAGEEVVDFSILLTPTG